MYNKRFYIGLEKNKNHIFIILIHTICLSLILILPQQWWLLINSYIQYLEWRQSLQIINSNSSYLTLKIRSKLFVITCKTKSRGWDSIIYKHYNDIITQQHYYAYGGSGSSPATGGFSIAEEFVQYNISLQIFFSYKVLQLNASERY